jgi:transcriptional regulator GlxA family with amidase domain
MKTIAIPLLKTKNSIGAVGPLEVLTKSSILWRQLAGSESSRPFDVCIVAESHKRLSFSNGVSLTPGATFGEVRPDLILVPSLEEDVRQSLQENQATVEWIKESFKKGAHVSSFCTGAFVLGQSGLLDGRRATTHWYFADEFRRMFPRVNLQERHTLVDEGNIVTCGGATFFLNLTIYLIEKYFGHDLAVHASKVFLIDMDRPSQLPFKIHAFSTAHGKPAIARVQAFIAEHFAENLKIADVAKKSGMSVRNFSRHFKSATGEALSSYVQRTRIEASKRLLETTNFSASEIMYKVGYNDERSFRRLFKQQTGLAPKYYRNKFKLGFSRAGSG